MTKSLTGNLIIEANWSFRKTGDLGATVDKNTQKYAQSFADGNGSGQIRQLWMDRRTVTLATQTDDIDIVGALTDVFGDTVTLATIKAIVIKNRSTTAGENLLVGAAASNPIADLFGDATDTIRVKAGGVHVSSAPLDGYTVAGGSADALRVEHDGAAGDIEYDIIIFGTVNNG